MNNLEKYELFKSKTLEERKKKSETYIEQNPERVPVFIINKKAAFQLERLKFLIPKTYKIQSLLKTIRNSNKLNKEQSLYISSNKRILSIVKEIGEIYNDDKDEDGFLYLEVTNIEAFGSLC